MAKYSAKVVLGKAEIERDCDGFAINQYWVILEDHDSKGSLVGLSYFQREDIIWWEVKAKTGETINLSGPPEGEVH